MDFKPIEYMEWMKTRERVKYDFCRSGVKDMSLKDLGIKADDLEIFGENSYGFPPLIKAVADRYKVEEENVMLTQGTSHALFLVCASLLKEGDEVLVEMPAYEPLRAVPQAFGARVLRLERRFETGYTVQLDEFEQRLSPGIKCVLLTNLHNPSGAVMSSSTLKDMAEIARRKDVVLVIDEIYLEFLESDSGQTSFHLGDNMAVISSLTKVFGLGDLRCGWVLATPELVKRMKIIQDYSIIEGVFIGELISSIIFGRLDAIREKKSKRISTNLRMIKEFVEGESRLEWIKPAGGVICFPRIINGLTGDEMARILRKEFDTAVIPGKLFEDSRHFRLGFDAGTEELAFVLDSMGQILERY
ncbi:MAG: pyridoxal phosphate-dependent aminotransferase [Candidatus Aminicenantes bacterium]|jgi:hypothetical protein